MIYTSYFAKARRLRGRLVSIALYPPRGMKVESEPRLAPSRELLRAYKAGEVDEAKYTEIFMRQLAKLDPIEIGRKLEGSILLCYEGPGKFCHRHLVAEWLRKAGFRVVEI